MCLFECVVMLGCIFDAFEWWVEMVECICASLLILKVIWIEENLI